MVAALPAVVPESGLSWVEVGTLNLSDTITATTQKTIELQMHSIERIVAWLISLS